MSIGSFLKKLASSAPVAAVATLIITDAQKAVAALKGTTIGEAVAAEIATLTNTSLTGAQKFEQVVATAAPLIVDFIAKGGKAAAVTEVEDIARALVQSIYNDTVSSKAATIAKAILGLLGIK